MKEIVDEVERWRERGEKVAVATVVATRMSAPRPVGAKFAVSESRRDRAVRSRAAASRTTWPSRRCEVIDNGEPRLLSYGISDDEALGVGLPCGGEIDVFVERLE